MGIKQVLETCLYVDDLGAAEAFYQNVLELNLYSKQTDRHLFFSLESQMLLLFKSESTLKKETLPTHGTIGPGHVAFGVEQSEIETWEKKLIDKKIEIELVHRWPNGVSSIYFRDPAGNSIEITNKSIWDL